MMSWAPLTCWATWGLLSKVCGSVFGLSRMEVTLTWLPPIWAITLPYSFSAPIAWIGGAEPAPAATVAGARAIPAATAPAAMKFLDLCPAPMPITISIINTDRKSDRHQGARAAGGVGAWVQRKAGF